MSNQVWLVIAALIIIALIAVGVWLYYKRYRTRQLKDRFGPEYDHTVRKLHDRDLAEAELKSREERVKRFHIVPLPEADCTAYEEEWIAIQGRFVDDPKVAVEEAHRLIFEVMKKRGYPTRDFEQAAADLSVEYPELVSNYRAASRIADENRRGAAKTEDLRQALVHYRALFSELLHRRGVAAQAGLRPQRNVGEQTEHREKGGVRT
jgi:FtsZ-interacting cell division protein ZipA